jgi:hypothetical protein
MQTHRFSTAREKATAVTLRHRQVRFGKRKKGQHVTFCIFILTRSVPGFHHNESVAGDLPPSSATQWSCCAHPVLKTASSTNVCLRHVSRCTLRCVGRVGLTHRALPLMKYYCSKDSTLCTFSKDISHAQVQIIHRHGDRTPFPLKDDKNFWPKRWYHKHLDKISSTNLPEKSKATSAWRVEENPSVN